jgi:hypothetical protein
MLLLSVLILFLLLSLSLQKKYDYYFEGESQEWGSSVDTHPFPYIHTPPSPSPSNALTKYLRDEWSMIKKSTGRIAIVAHRRKTPATIPTRSNVFCFDVKSLKDSNNRWRWKYSLAHLYHCLISPEGFFDWVALLGLGSSAETSFKLSGAAGTPNTSFLVIIGQDFADFGCNGSFSDEKGGRVRFVCTLGVISWQSSSTIGAT